MNGTSPSPLSVEPEDPESNILNVFNQPDAVVNNLAIDTEAETIEEAPESVEVGKILSYLASIKNPHNKQGWNIDVPYTIVAIHDSEMVRVEFTFTEETIHLLPKLSGIIKMSPILCSLSVQEVNQLEDTNVLEIKFYQKQEG